MFIGSRAASFKRPLLSIDVCLCVCLCVGNFDAKYCYSVSQKIPPAVFRQFFPKWLGIFNKFSHTYYGFLPTLDYKFLFNYLQIWRSYITLSETTHRISYISLELNFEVCLLSKWRHCWRHVISSMFGDIIKAADLGWLATDIDQQSYQRLLQTSVNACVSADGGHFDHIVRTS